MIKYIVKFTYLKKVVTNGRRGTFSVLAFTTIFLQVNLIKKSKTSKKIFTVKPFLSSHPLLGSHCNVPETVALITVKLTCIKHSLTSRVCSFRRIQKRIFYPRFARFRGQKEREIRNWICNLGQICNLWQIMRLYRAEFSGRQFE